MIPRNDGPYLKLRVGCGLLGQATDEQFAGGRQDPQNRISDSQNLGLDKDKSFGGFKCAASNTTYATKPLRILFLLNLHL